MGSWCIPHAGAVIRRQGERTDLTSGQNVQKSETAEYPPRGRGDPGTKKGAKGQRMRIPHAGVGPPPTGARSVLIGAVFADLAALRKTACILGKACYNGVRSCSGGAETPRSAAQVRYHPGKGSIAQPALGDNHLARVFCCLVVLQRYLALVGEALERAHKAIVQ